MATLTHIQLTVVGCNFEALSFGDARAKAKALLDLGVPVSLEFVRAPGRSDAELLAECRQRAERREREWQTCQETQRRAIKRLEQKVAAKKPKAKKKAKP